MLANTICGLSSHKINRRKVWDDTLNFRTDCERCGKPMIRLREGWVAFDSAKHGNTERRSRDQSEAVKA